MSRTECLICGEPVAAAGLCLHHLADWSKTEEKAQTEEEAQGK